MFLLQGGYYTLDELVKLIRDKQPLKITKDGEQYVLNDGIDSYVIFDYMENNDNVNVVLKRKENATDGKGNWYPVQVGLATLFGDKMREALAIMHDLGAKVEMIKSKDIIAFHKNH